MSTQKMLFQYNRDRIQDHTINNAKLLEYEHEWISNRLNTIHLQGNPINRKEFEGKFSKLIALETEEKSSLIDYVTDSMNIYEFKKFVEEFAIDGLTEAQVFYYIMPRLPLEAQMPMLRIMIDEFGSGNFHKAHTNLYKKLLNELSMPTHYEYYIEHTSETSFEFVNLFYWLTLRSDDPSYFVGALSYLETIIPSAFECFVDGCRRLNIESHTYYSEHQHIDVFHAKECMRILKIMDSNQCLNSSKAWDGVKLASTITNQAFNNAVLKAKNMNSIYNEKIQMETRL